MEEATEAVNGLSSSASRLQEGSTGSAAHGARAPGNPGLGARTRGSLATASTHSLPGAATGPAGRGGPAPSGGRPCEDVLLETLKHGLEGGDQEVPGPKLTAGLSRSGRRALAQDPQEGPRRGQQRRTHGQREGEKRA